MKILLMDNNNIVLLINLKPNIKVHYRILINKKT